MRYLLAGLTVVVVALAVGALISTVEWGSATASAPEAPAKATPLAPSVPSVVPTLARVRVPYTRLPVEAVSRAKAIEVGRSDAGRMHEDEPELIGASLMTLGEARRRLRADDAETGVPDEALVWVVWMRGTFMPSSAPGPEQMISEEGWAYSVVNAKTGQTMGWGYRNPDTPF